MNNSAVRSASEEQAEGGPAPATNAEDHKKWRAWVMPVALVLLVLTLNFMAEWNASFWDPSGDMRTIFSIAAAMDHPEAFENDATYADPQHYRFYTPVFIAGVRLFHRLTGDYASFCRFFSPVLLLLQLVAFYLLGRELLGSRWAGLALALLSLCYKFLPRGTYIGWRGYRDVTPRTFLLSLAPFIFYFALRYRKNPRVWFGSMVLMGVLLYVHPVSAPVLALALWASFFAFHPKKWSWRRRLATSLAYGATFLLVIFPYALWYRANICLGKSLSGSVGCEEAYVLLDSRVSDALSVWPSFAATCYLWIKTPLLAIFLLACAGAVLGLLNRSTRNVAIICLLWLAGVWGASFLVPLADQVFGRLSGRLPSQISLARGMRYFSWPLLGLMLLLPQAARELVKRWPDRRKLGIWLPRGVLAVTILGGAYMLYECPPLRIKHLIAHEWKRGRLVLEASESQERLLELLDAIKEQTPPGARLISAHEGAATVGRFYCLRPVAHCRKDGALILYTNLQAMRTWAANEKTWRAACVEAKRGDVRPLVLAARELKADYLLVHRIRRNRRRRTPGGRRGRWVYSRILMEPEPGTRTVYQNENWYLVEIGSESGK